MIETGKIINGDCIEVMKTLPEGSVDLIVTSPPYGVGIAYDVHEDDVNFVEYQEFAKNWLSEFATDEYRYDMKDLCSIDTSSLNEKQKE